MTWVAVAALLLGANNGPPARPTLAGASAQFTVKMDFEKFAPGDVAEGDDGFSDAANDSVVVRGAAVGRQAAELRVTKGQTGWGRWGGRRYFPAPVRKGESLWIRVVTRFPKGFDFAADPWLKFLRIHTRAPDGKHEGYVDWLLHEPRPGRLPFRYASEVGSGEDTDCGTPADAPRPDAWETYEMQVVFDDVPAAQGGSGLVRLWKEGRLLCEVRSGKTLRHAGSVADAFLFSTSWNGGAPATQSMLLDGVVVTTATPSATDAAGRPMIGVP
jgi:hypothetical protein